MATLLIFVSLSVLKAFSLIGRFLCEERAVTPYEPRANPYELTPTSSNQQINKSTLIK